MPYDPYAQPNPWWQHQQGPQQGAQFAQPPAAQRPKQWWEGMPMAKPGQFAKSANSPDDANSANPSPSLLQMLMLGGKPTYNGTPTGSGAPGGATSPWSWMGSMFGGPAR